MMVRSWALLAVVSLPSCALAQHRIGAAAAVAGKVQAIRPDKVGRVVSSGQPLHLGETIKTDAAGRLQILLLDQTVFTIGPSSDLTLDEFVYDPNTNAGKVTARVTKGVFRFVTGKVARKEPASMKVTTPVGTIGIRGTIAGGQVSQDGSSGQFVLIGPGANNNAGETPGSVSVGNEAGSVNLDTPGFGTTMGQGSAPAAPSDMSDFAGSLGEALDGGDAGADEGSAAEGEGEGGEQSSAEDDAGESTASGGELAVESEELAAEAEEYDDTTIVAAQDEADAEGAFHGVTQWDQLAQLQGVDYFDGENGGYYSCTTGCSTGGDMAFHFVIDFDARTLGTDNALSHIKLLNGDLANEEALIPVVDFSALAGDATLVIGSDFTLSNESTVFDGTTITINNANGRVADYATVDLRYDNGDGTTADGYGEAIRVDDVPQL